MYPVHHRYVAWSENGRKTHCKKKLLPHCTATVQCGIFIKLGSASGLNMLLT